MDVGVLADEMVQCGLALYVVEDVVWVKRPMVEVSEEQQVAVRVTVDRGTFRGRVAGLTEGKPRTRRVWLQLRPGNDHRVGSWWVRGASRRVDRLRKRWKTCAVDVLGGRVVVPDVLALRNRV